MQPTTEAYSEQQTAYDHFNTWLFNDELPQCLITFQREKRTHGYFSHERFVNGLGEKTDEIAMNPSYFAVVPALEIMQTIVHEMVHLWQFHFGKPGRRGYHNKEFAAKMEEIGLMPSDTGKEGGRKVGEKMADYVIPGGRFEEANKRLLGENFTITWKDRFPSSTQIAEVVAGDVEGVGAEELIALGIDLEQPETKSNRRKYKCPTCAINAWGKPNLNLVCGDCQERLVDCGT